MNIIYAKMEGYDWVSTPSDAVARELEAQGHTVALVSSFHHIPQGNFDFVWSPYESATLIGDYLSKKLGIPHYSHIEWLPVWRIFNDVKLEEYGHTKESADVARLPQTMKYYREVGEAWINSAVYSLPGEIRVDMHKKFLGDFPTPTYRWPSIDARTIETAKRMLTIKRKKDQVLTVCRLVPEKRMDLVVETLNQIKSKVTWALVGDGPVIESIKNNLTNSNVIVNHYGSLWGWARFEKMMESSIHLGALTPMPTLESALLGCAPIAIESQPTTHCPDWDKINKDNVGDAVPIFEHNETDKAAKLLDEELANPHILEKYETTAKFSNQECNMTSSAVNAADLVQNMENYVG
jgi:glycosyltransferase involved in cell wall biosynthesis